MQRVSCPGMLTHGPTEFYVCRIDPETQALRSYAPDLWVQRDDQVAKPVMLVKQDSGLQMAVTSGMTYGVLKGSECESGDYGFVLRGEARPETESYL